VQRNCCSTGRISQRRKMPGEDFPIAATPPSIPSPIAELGLPPPLTSKTGVFFLFSMLLFLSPHQLVIDVVPSHLFEGDADLPPTPAPAPKSPNSASIQFARHRNCREMTGRPDVRDEGCQAREPVSHDPSFRHHRKALEKLVNVRCPPASSR
jgi:hypothetical protein